MPQLIPNVDDYFSKMKKDLYLLKISNEKSEHKILTWFSSNLPEINVNRIFPFTKSSGMISSPEIAYSIEFNEETLKTFCKQWEDEDGNSLDKGFQCYLWPLPLEHKK